MKIDATAQFWRTKGLSVRASNCLAKANIANEQELIHKFTTFDSLIALRNCGRKTAKEIGTFITNLNLVCDCCQESEINSSNSNGEHSAKAQSVFIPLLNIKVSAHIWEALQKIPINSIRCNSRTKIMIYLPGVQQLADICLFSSEELLSFRNFGLISLIKLQECLIETIEQLRTNPHVLDLSDEHSIEAQWIFLPFLNMKVSGSTWKALQKISIHSIPWSSGTRKLIRQQGLQVLADICLFSLRAQLSLRNFNISWKWKELQDRLTETIEQLQTNPHLSDSELDHFFKIFVPLLNMNVSTQTWEALQKTPVNSIRWNSRTQNVIEQQELIVLADICLFSPEEWLNFRRFGHTYLTELQERMTETIEQFRANPHLPDLSDRHSHSIEEQWVFVPLLNIIVSAQTWEALQKIPVNNIPWGFRTLSAIKQQRLQVLADLCQFSPRKLLRYSSFCTVSLRDIQEHLTETIEQLQANSNVLDSKLDHFFKIFIPLLNIKVSANTWKTLQNRYIHQSNWSGRVQNILLAQDFKTLADIAELSPPQWLRFRNCGRKSLAEIQETVNKVIANLDVLESKGNQI